MRVSIDRKKGEVEVFARKTVVEEVEDDQTQISLEEARAIDPVYEVGDLIGRKSPPASLAESRRRPPSRWSCRRSARPSAA